MAMYRCYILDGAGRASDAGQVEAPTDAIARETALALLDRKPGAQTVELWRDGRKVIREARNPDGRPHQVLRAPRDDPGDLLRGDPRTLNRDLRQVIRDATSRAHAMLSVGRARPKPPKPNE